MACLNKEQLAKSIETILFDMGKNITIHKIDLENIIIDVPYNKYIDLIIKAVNDLHIEDSNK